MAMTSLRYYRYKKFLLLLMIFASATIFMLAYRDSKASERLIIYDGVLKNMSLIRLQPTFRPLKTIEIFKIQNDTKPQAAPVACVTSVDKDSSKPLAVKSEVNNSDITKNLTQKTFYPVTLYAPYLIENPTLCSSVKNLSIIVIVHSAPGNLPRRNTIRATWTNETYFKHLGRVRVLFLLGRVKDERVQESIETEFVEYGDLLQGDFIDAYHNLTHKGVMAYKWLSERCTNARLVMKVDDDVVVNTYEILTTYLSKFQNKSKQILCNHILPGTMPIIRQKKNKWYVDESSFRGKKFYPRYCSGFTVLFTNDFMSALHRAASLTPFFWVDDVYLYGMVPAKVPGIQYNGFKGSDHQLTGPMAIKCYTNATRTCNFLVAGAGQRSVAETIWSFMTKQYEHKVMKIGYTKVLTLPTSPPKTTAKAVDGSSI